MATVVSFAQDVITCDLCDNPTQQFCNNCQVSLCVSCVSKHVDAHKTLAHDIVSFTNRKIQLVYTKCLRHPDQRCEAYCRKCDSPVCMKCILGPHKGHDAVEVSEVVDSRKKELRKDNDEIETILIPKYTECEVAIRSKISESNTRFGYSANEIEKNRNLWHQEVDVIFDTMGSMLQSTKENHMDSLATRQGSLRNVILRLETQLKENKKILKSINMSEINNYKSDLEEYRDIVLDTDVNIPSLKSSAVQGSDLSVELGEFKATLKQTSKNTEIPEERKKQEKMKKLEEERQEKERMEREKADQARKEAEEKLRRLNFAESQPSKPKTIPSPNLPTGWEKRLDPNTRRYYYINHNKGTTQWEAPFTQTNITKKKSPSKLKHIRDKTLSE